MFVWIRFLTINKPKFAELNHFWSTWPIYRLLRNRSYESLWTGETQYDFQIRSPYRFHNPKWYPILQLSFVVAMEEVLHHSRQLLKKANIKLTPLLDNLMPVLPRLRARQRVLCKICCSDWLPCLAGLSAFLGGIGGGAASNESTDWPRSRYSFLAELLANLLNSCSLRQVFSRGLC